MQHANLSASASSTAIEDLAIMSLAAPEIVFTDPGHTERAVYPCTPENVGAYARACVLVGRFALDSYTEEEAVMLDTETGGRITVNLDTGMVGVIPAGGEWHRHPLSKDRFPMIAVSEYIPQGKLRSATAGATRFFNAPKGSARYFTISGDTFPLSGLLKDWGCRWNAAARWWVFVGEEFPEALRRDLDRFMDAPLMADGYLTTKYSILWELLMGLEMAFIPPTEWTLGLSPQGESDRAFRQEVWLKRMGQPLHTFPG